MLGGGTVEIDIPALKEASQKLASKAKSDSDFDKIEAELLKKFSQKERQKQEQE